MLNYDWNKPLIAIHIPKTGGSSFREILKKWFKENYLRHYFDEKKNRMPERHELKPGICICGHFNKKRNFGIQDYYPEVDQFVTILRDPSEIVVSRYFFEKKREMNNTSFRDGKKFKLTDDIAEYLEEEILKSDYHPNILDYMPVEMTFENYKDVIHNYFIFIGILEDFQYSIDKIAQKLNYTTFKATVMNKSQRFERVLPGFRQRFIDLHPLEYEIYHYVMEIYKR
jgi:hypothetical protein